MSAQRSSLLMSYLLVHILDHTFLNSELSELVELKDYIIKLVNWFTIIIYVSSADQSLWCCFILTLQQHMMMDISSTVIKTDQIKKKQEDHYVMVFFKVM